MALTVIDVPPLVKFRTTNWQQSGGVIYQRSEFTGRTKTLQTGPASRWSCDFEMVPVRDDAQITQARSFMATLSRPEYAVRIPFNTVSQTGTATCLVNGGPQLGDTINVKGLPASTTVLSAGHFITFNLATDDEQTAVLLTALVSDGAGNATAFINRPLRKAVVNNGVVRLAVATAIMRVPDAVKFTLTPSQIHEWPELKAVEAF
jgi:hypothetical protein